MDAQFGLYIHVPFCLRRCTYCDFFSTEGKLSLLPAYTRCLMDEIRAAGRSARIAGQRGVTPDVTSIYFGGGTPSLMRPEAVRKILIAVKESFRLSGGAEITLEANPGSVDEPRLAAFRAAGINRISFGAQSADARDLRLLGRIHSWPDVERAVRDARRAGFGNLSLDLMYGLPGQSLSAWEENLRRAAALGPEHISAYALTLGRGTALARAVRRGASPRPDDDDAADMYLRAEEFLSAAGFRHYEISNWARNGRSSAEDFPEYACRHNLLYWRNLPYLGIGAAAHGCAGGRRYANIRSVEKYIQRIRDGGPRKYPLTAAVAEYHVRSADEELRERMWLGLRLVERGVDWEEIRDQAGEDIRIRFAAEIAESAAEGLLEWTADGARLRLAPRGRLLGNRVFSKFV